ncbi:MAG: CoA transferase, partial [Spirochaetaceae bacterium]|nr:CoA transferase [Spirochaetaceae bacterium]
PAGAVFNRGKQVVELDLKSAAGRAAAQRLVAAADVVIENFRPGVMDRLGLGATAMTEANPRLVYLSLPGFGAGEKNASLRAFEGVLNAATGVYTDLHAIRRALHAPPQYTPIPLASAYGAVHGAIAVAMALYAREESGRGEAIEVPLAGAAMSAMGAFLLRVADAPARYGKRPNPANDGLREQMRHADADERRRLIDAQRPWLPVMFDSYQAGDGRWVFLLAGNSRRNSVQLIKALGIYDALIADGMIDLPPWPDLTRPNNIQDIDGLSREFRKILRDRMTAAFRQKPADDWTPIMRAHGVPFSVHRSTQEWLHRPETDAAALTVEVNDPVHGAIRQFGVQTSLGRTAREWHVPRPARAVDLAALLHDLPAANGNGAAAPTTGAAPRSDGSAVARTAHRARQSAEQAPPAARGGILAGIKVLDLSTVLAGPCCARTLAEYGADVIKIDSPHPYFLPSTACYLHLEVGQGKRSMILDLKQAAGKRLFEQLAAGADVIVHNFRPGVAERLGIDHAKMARINPGIVYLNLTAFNGPRRGPWTELPGFDPVLQAATGIQQRYGGPGGPPELHGFASCIDYITGYSGAYGIALALLRRKREGGGDLVFTSLAQGGQLVQAPFAWATADALPDDGPQGQEVLGKHSLEHLYRAADGWLVLTGLPEDLPRLRDVPGLAAAPVSADQDAERIAALQAAIAEQPVAHWEQAFSAAGFGCHRVDYIEDIRRAGLRAITDAERASWCERESISVIRLLDHPAGSAVDNPAPTYARFADTALRIAAPMPKIGAHTRAVLRELGHDDAQIDRWIADGAAAEQLHDAYLPH